MPDTGPEPAAPSNPPAAARAHRRRGLMTAAAVLALAGGAGVAWWQRNRGLLQPVPDAATQAFWSSRFETPDGQTLEMARWRGRRLLVNFWATWCPPCVEEMPLIDGFYRQYADKGWQVIGLAIDQPSAVRTFLARIPVRFPIGLAGLDGTSLGRQLGNVTGGLPFTVIMGRDGEVAHRRLGKVSAADLDQWATLK